MSKRSRSSFISRSFSSISNPVFKGFWLSAFSFQLFSCSTQKQISKVANEVLFTDTSLQHAHTGISLFDVSANKYLYTYNAQKYFVPASNTKLFSTYAALKYLGDSLPGIRYWENDTAVFLVGTGDPTLL